MDEHLARARQRQVQVASITVHVCHRAAVALGRLEGDVQLDDTGSAVDRKYGILQAYPLLEDADITQARPSAA